MVGRVQIVTNKCLISAPHHRRSLVQSVYQIEILMRVRSIFIGPDQQVVERGLFFQYLDQWISDGRVQIRIGSNDDDKVRGRLPRERSEEKGLKEFQASQAETGQIGLMLHKSRVYNMNHPRGGGGGGGSGGWWMSR